MRPLVGGGGEQEERDPGRGRLRDHRGPGRLGALEADAAVIGRIIDDDAVRLVAEDVGREPTRTGFGLLAADAGDDDIDHGIGEACFRPRWRRGG